jgi:hypothetical protein
MHNEMIAISIRKDLALGLKNQKSNWLFQNIK